jgi:prepilin-type N-terminal cleavage/methylation domain-containing protein
MKINKLFSSKGFTLIELLVVISIISLLASVVMSSLASARKKALMQSAISQAIEMRNIAELYHSQNGYYSEDLNGIDATGWNNACLEDPEYGFLGTDSTDRLSRIKTIISDYNIGGPFTSGSDDRLICGYSDNGQSYVVAMKFQPGAIIDFIDPSDGSEYNWDINSVCLDSTGFVGFTARGFDEMEFTASSVFSCDRRTP